ncbi:hypothetical protein B9Z19DRAFT_1135581 [Tuber borchii]|uniref:Uncharacterized protein n=1 Tax=Tuber borchii TaxID=42251 RepID=A0A2T6ZCN7_TUBBO|nr:hypothetical protein B9Z19DRAFT_1135581 [Tuber borchii]
MVTISLLDVLLDFTVEEAPSIVPPNFVSTAVTATEDSSAIPAPEILTPSPVFIYNDHFNAYIVGTSFDTFLNNQTGIAEEGRVLRVGGSLAPRRPENAVLSSSVRGGTLSSYRG